MTIDEILYKKFGYHHWREGQREIIEDILAARHVVAMLPTGGGKSMCYQLPAYLLDGSVIIISPLLSLMEDQVEQLRAIGEKRVIAFNSFRSIEEKRTAIGNLSKYKFIFVSPEMLGYEFFFQRLMGLNISLFVIDEAHCISQWGYEFRPDYMRLKGYIKRLGSPTCLALTATATEEVLRDIIQSLGLEDVKHHLYSINRKNIAIAVEKVETYGEKMEKLLHYVQMFQGPGIIYCSSRTLTENIVARLKEIGIENAEAYHGGMTSEHRMLIQQQFMNDQLAIIVSTSAFGMGVNKSNVRYVIHFHYPANIESYLQEIGRCGRDGGDSIAILLASPNDHELPLQLLIDELPTMEQVQFVLSRLATMQQLTDSLEQELMIAAGLDDIKWRFMLHHLQKLKVLEGKRIYPEKIESNILHYFHGIIEERIKHKKKSLHIMKQWVETVSCRREAYLKIFGERLLEKPKYCCDICGIELEHYQKQKKDEYFSRSGWEEELQMILGI